MATMKEIAELAGVSRGTVDRVLNHRGIVNAETQKKVLEIAKLLNYQPNKAGIALAAQKKKLKIGVVFFDAGNPFFDQVMAGLSKKLEELSIYGCSVVEKRVPFDPLIQLETIDGLVNEDIHGLLLTPYNDIRIRDKIDELWQKGIPCVTVNSDLPESRRISYVGSDFKKCGRTAAGLLNLITQGNANVGIVTGSRNILCHTERVSGFMEQVGAFYPDIHVAEVVENGDDDYLSYEAVASLLRRNPSLTSLYFTAAGVYGGCRAVLNASKQSALKIITFDDVPSTRELIEQDVITATICQQPGRQGASSLGILINYLLTGKAPNNKCQYTKLSIKIKENL